MFGRVLSTAVLCVAFVGCDVSSGSDAARSDAGSSPTPIAARTGAATATAAATSTVVATAAPPAPVVPPTAANPAPPSGARVSVLPSTTGVLGSAFLFQLVGFPAGTFVVTITYPNGIPKNQVGQVGQDGRGSLTFSTTSQDLVGRYTFRFDSGSTSVTTTIQVTR